MRQLACFVTQLLHPSQLGAVDILQTPVATQTGRLATLWQHTLRKRPSRIAALGGSDSLDTGSGAGSTAAGGQLCSEGDDLVKAILPDLFDPELWEQPEISGLDGSSIDMPDTPDICQRLSQVCQPSLQLRAVTMLSTTDYSIFCCCTELDRQRRLELLLPA